MYQRDEPRNPPQWSIERNLVQVLDDDIIVLAGELFRVVAVHDEWKAVARANAMDGDSVEHSVSRRFAEAGAQKIDPVSGDDDAPKNLVEMDLRPARLWIEMILPVDDEDLHPIIPVFLA